MPAEKLPQAKTCSKCGETKALEDFYRHRTGKGGRRSQCRDCTRAVARAWERANPEKRASQMKRFRGKHPDARKRHQQRHPERFIARVMANRAVRAGRLHKPDHCERCQERVTKSDLHGHHEDYSKPLEVEWLCVQCHRAHHASMLTNASAIQPQSKGEK